VQYRSYEAPQCAVFSSLPLRLPLTYSFLTLLNDIVLSIGSIMTL